MVPGILGPHHTCGCEIMGVVLQFVACMWLHLCGSMYLGPCGGSMRGPLIEGCGPSFCGVFVAPFMWLYAFGSVWVQERTPH